MNEIRVYNIMRDPDSIAYYLKQMGLISLQNVVSIRVERGQDNNFLLIVTFYE